MAYAQKSEKIGDSLAGLFAPKKGYGPGFASGRESDNDLMNAPGKDPDSDPGQNQPAAPQKDRGAQLDALLADLARELNGLKDYYVEVSDSAAQRAIRQRIVGTFQRRRAAILPIKEQDSQWEADIIGHAVNRVLIDERHRNIDSLRQESISKDMNTLRYAIYESYLK